MSFLDRPLATFEGEVTKLIQTTHQSRELEPNNNDDDEENRVEVTGSAEGEGSAFFAMWECVSDPEQDCRESVSSSST